MLTALMITRSRWSALVGGVLVFAASACEKVPLLAPAGSVINLTASSTSLGSNGSTQIIAQVIEPAGTPPHSGTQIIFTTTLGSVEPSETSTDINGRATVTFRANGASGTATITATSGGVSASGTNAIRIAVGSAAVGRVTVDASPAVVPASGGATTIISFVFDSNGNPIGGVPVTFTTDAGTLSPSLVSSDQNGRAQTTLTTSKTAKVTATAGVSGSSGGGGGTGGGTGGTGGGTTTTSSQSATVTVTVNTPSAISFGSGTPTTTTAGQAVVFPLTYSTSGTPITRVTVDFNDGPPQTFNGQPSSVSHAFSHSGSFLVQVTGTDAFGDTSNASTAITVSSLSGTITFSPAAPTSGQIVSFTLAVTPANTALQSVTWNWGPGDSVTIPGNGTQASHRFASGQFVVTATFTDVNGSTGTAGAQLIVQ